MPGPNWAEQVTAIATAVGALGLLGALGAAAFAGQQVKEARKARESQIAADFFRRWDEESLVETRRLVATFETKEELATAFQAFITSNADEAYVLYRELDYFEQLAALEHVGAFDFELIKLLLGRTLIDRWEVWKPSVDAMKGTGGYPMFEALVAKMKSATTSVGSVVDSPRSDPG
ncbi:MAG TPA: hypothetical protein VNV83_11110 [Acidimicrobiales bacterium]|nr:hypothetical protein [Acidimicrobiales bacterium]